MADRADLVHLQARIRRVGTSVQVYEELLAPLVPVLSPLLDIKV